MRKITATMLVMLFVFSALAIGSAYAQTTDYTGTAISPTNQTGSTSTGTDTTSTGSTSTTNTGSSGTTGTSTSTTPGTPNTGAGGDAANNIWLMAVSSLALLGGGTYLMRSRIAFQR